METILLFRGKDKLLAGGKIEKNIYASLGEELPLSQQDFKVTGSGPTPAEALRKLADIIDNHWVALDLYPRETD